MIAFKVFVEHILSDIVVKFIKITKKKIFAEETLFTYIKVDLMPGFVPLFATVDQKLADITANFVNSFLMNTTQLIAK